MKICIIKGCGLTHFAKGFCKEHYNRARGFKRTNGLGWDYVLSAAGQQFVAMKSSKKNALPAFSRSASMKQLVDQIEETEAHLRKLKAQLRNEVEHFTTEKSS